ncbi:MAG: TAXI family TRAP transporter solute-binding subunit [Desulfurococcaceae archaeon]
MSRSLLIAMLAVVVIVIGVIAYQAYQPATTPTPTQTQTPTLTPTTPITTTTPTTTPLTKITLQWGTASVGSAGYVTLSLIAEVVNRNMPDLEVVVVPTAGAVASIKSYTTYQLDGCYASTPSFTELYTLTGRFAGFQPQRYPLQTFWVFTNEVTIAIHQRNLGKYKCWADLNGTKMFTGPMGWDVGVALRTALSLLNISYEHIELDWAMLADALERGTVEATILYTNGRYGITDFFRQLELGAPIAILNPCPNELATLKERAPGTGIIYVAENYVDPKQVFTTDVKLNYGTKMSAVAFFYGFHVGPEVSEDVVYRFIKTLEAKAGELANLNPMLRLLSEDFIGLQAGGIEANKNVPVHPGLAKYMKERGIWNNEWRVGS